MARKKASKTKFRESIESLKEPAPGAAEAASASDGFEHLFRAQFEHTPDTIFIVDREFKILAVNHVISPSLKNQKLIGRGVADLLPDASKTLALKALEKCVEGGTIQEFEHYLVDGHIARTRYIPLRDSSDAVSNVMIISKDITAGKKAEELLVKNEERLRRLTEQAPGGFFQLRMTPDGRFNVPFASNQFYEMYGFSEENLRNDATEMFSTVHPEELNQVMGAVMESARDMTVFKQEFRVKVGGEYIWQMIRSRPEPHPDGGVVWHGFSADITEQKNLQIKLESARFEIEKIVEERTRELKEKNEQLVREMEVRRSAEEELRRSEEKYRGIFDESVATIYVFDNEKRFLDSNQAGLELLGYSREELLAMSIPDVDADPDAVLPAHEELLSGGKLVGFEHQLKRKDGAIVTVLNHSKPLTDAAGNVVGMQSTLMNITKRRAAQEALKESEERHRILFESSRDAIMTLEPPDWKFTGGNPATIELFEAESIERFTSAGPWELSPERQPDGRLSSDKARECIGAAIEHGSYFFEWTHKTFKGNIFPATVLLTRMELGGKTLLQATVRDITQLKKAEEEKDRLRQQLLHSQKMEAIGHLAGGIAHDFNNILATMSGTAEVLLNKTPEDSPLRKGLERIVKSGRRARNLTMKLLTFARKEKLEMTSINLNSLVDEIVEMLKGSISKSVRIVTECDDSIPATRADITQMTQALLNICLNSCDAMPDGGTLSMRTFFTEPGGRDHEAAAARGFSGAYCGIEVADTGNGIPADVMDKIFEPFFTTKDKGKGSGLGLAVTLGIVENHAGLIDISSAPDSGTTIKIFLPVTGASEAEGQQEFETKSPARHSGRVLIIDDDKNYLETVREILEDSKYSVVACLTGDSGLESYRKQFSEIDCVLLDMIMLETDPAHVFDTLRSINPDCKIILCSGYSMEGKVSELMGRGASAFIQKPFSINEFISLVSAVITA